MRTPKTRLREATVGGAETQLLAVDDVRKEASARLDSWRRAQMGQFFTLSLVAAFMAGMFDCRKPAVRIFDFGAGAGILCAALALTLCY